MTRTWKSVGSGPEEGQRSSGLGRAATCSCTSGRSGIGHDHHEGRSCQVNGDDDDASRRGGSALILPSLILKSILSNQFLLAVAYLTDSDSTATAPALSGVGAAPPGGWSLSLLITVLLSASLQPGFCVCFWILRCGLSLADSDSTRLEAPHRL
eukprot:CAMPEP_0178664604 /NCGR_PEP_ID=MMETSP0698-20121128/29481_1 /TAXON_ID=265572 /ORGANISM="Extubocellulus spinifer, Strain CCMP396" /LENGTH=153 /DNA_ID=CAMNT_0020307807 /DNA_START=203 /DNA_END=666 /DNA_ORIENTATION=+